MTLRKLTEQEHGELCQYLDEWCLLYFNDFRPKENSTDAYKKAYYAQSDYGKLVSDTLSDLVVADATANGL